jgi:hypothetical protein
MTYVSQPKVLMTTEDYHMISTINILMNRMGRKMERNTGGEGAAHGTSFRDLSMNRVSGQLHVLATSLLVSMGGPRTVDVAILLKYVLLLEMKPQPFPFSVI